MEEEGARVIRVLLLDDNLMTSARVQAALRSQGCEVALARTVPESGGFDFVLLNLGSRRLGGLELLPRVRERLPQASVYGFCGHREVEIRQAAKAAGIDRLLTNETVAALEWLPAKINTLRQ
jgi:DNA-binding response OmpR family regulator